jgi:hypothetical protein
LDYCLSKKPVHLGSGLQEAGMRQVMGTRVIRMNNRKHRGMFNNLTKGIKRQKRKASIEQLVFVVRSLLFLSNRLKCDCCDGEGSSI